MTYTDPYINIHTHSYTGSKDVIEVVSVMAKDLDTSNLPSKYTASGLHPWDITNAADLLKFLDSAIRKDRIKAVGECGLDKACDTDFEDQLLVFKKQLKLAKKYEVPAIVHCVRAFDHILSIKKNMYEVPLIIHGFRGKEQLASQLIDKGIFISLGESLFREPSIQKLALTIPLKQLFLETDEADVDIRALYEWVAELRGISITELKEIIYKNFRRIFL